MKYSKKLFIILAVLILLSLTLKSSYLGKNNVNLNSQLQGNKDFVFQGRKLNIKNVRNIWYLQNNFGNYSGGHVLVTFEFLDGTLMTSSANFTTNDEMVYNPILSLFDVYFLEFKFENEKDALLRISNSDTKEVYRYKLSLTDEEKVRFLKNWIQYSEFTSDKSIYYNLLKRSCSTTFFEVLQSSLATKKIKADWSVKIPNFLDKKLYSEDLLDCNSDNSIDDFQACRQNAKINPFVEQL